MSAVQSQARITKNPIREPAGELGGRKKFLDFFDIFDVRKDTVNYKNFC